MCEVNSCPAYELRWDHYFEEVALSKEQIDSVQSFLNAVDQIRTSWSTETFPWFRGEPANVKTPLIPKLYREKEDGSLHQENKLLQYFRMRAPVLGGESIPERGETDKWLFLAQHVGLPTRLLDWSENALCALHFAIEPSGYTGEGSGSPTVWMLDYVELNNLTLFELGEDMVPNAPTITWIKNLYNKNIRGAWELNRIGTELPIAIHATYIHPRMHSQRSCFTINGIDDEGFNKVLPNENVIRGILIDEGEIPIIRKQLREMGITHGALFPELDGLAKELTTVF